MVLRLHTLGGLAVHGPTGAIAGAAAQPRRLAVLALVARGGDRGTPRARLVQLLWPDADDAQSRRALAQALYALRRDLGHDDAIVGTQVLQLHADHVGSDVADLESAIDSGDLQRAVALYAGPFLEGFRLSAAPEFERWADDERTAIEHRVHDALEALAASAEDDRDFHAAARWWRRRASSDPLNARVAMALMRAVAASGDRAGAIRHAELFEALIAEALEMPADGDVITLAKELRQSASPAPARTIASAVTALAILPFTILGGDTTGEVRGWSEGLVEEFEFALLEARVVPIVGRRASADMGASPTLAQLRTLGASHVVEGTVRLTAEGRRTTVRLVETAGGRTEWWERTTTPSEDGADSLEVVAARFAEGVVEQIRCVAENGSRDG